MNGWFSGSGHRTLDLESIKIVYFPVHMIKTVPSGSLVGWTREKLWSLVGSEPVQGRCA
jgi:hypothetical protein